MSFVLRNNVLRYYHNHRTALCKFRCGVTPLRFESGKYEGLAGERRTCPFYDTNSIFTIENVRHVLLECSLYNNIRDTLLSKARVLWT